MGLTLHNRNAPVCKEAKPPFVSAKPLAGATEKDVGGLRAFLIYVVIMHHCVFLASPSLCCVTNSMRYLPTRTDAGPVAPVRVSCDGFKVILGNVARVSRFGSQSSNRPMIFCLRTYAPIC